MIYITDKLRLKRLQSIWNKHTKILTEEEKIFIRKQREKLEKDTSIDSNNKIAKSLIRKEILIYIPFKDCVSFQNWAWDYFISKPSTLRLKIKGE